MVKSDIITKWIIHLLLSALVVVTIYPLLYVLFASLSDGDQLMAHRGLLLRPAGFSTFAYVRALANPMIWTGFRNTLLLVGGGIILNLTMTILGAYVLSRKNVSWTRYLLYFIMLTMFVNGGMIPFYLVVKGLGMINTLWSILIPFAVKTFHLIIMRTAFMTLPDSIEESALMDGANHFTLLFRIIVPLSMPVISVIILYTTVDKWNMWFYPSAFIQQRELFPLQLVLRAVLINDETDNLIFGTGGGEARKIGETIKYATIMITTAPVLILYPFLQKYFVNGVMVGAIKG